MQTQVNHMVINNWKKAADKGGRDPLCPANIEEIET